VPQWRRTAEQKFLTDLRLISDARGAIRLRERMGDGLTGYYITHFEALSQAGKVEEMSHVHWQRTKDDFGRPKQTPFIIGRRLSERGEGYWGENVVTLDVDGERHLHRLIPLDHCPKCGQSIEVFEHWPLTRQTRDLIERQGRNTTYRYLALKEDGRLKKSDDDRQADVAWNWRTAAGSNGPRAIRARCSRCGYTHVSRRLKPAAYWLRDLFDCIIVDEGTKVKNMDSQTSQAVQGLRAPHRLLLTGTPIKNYIVDMFPLMWWALGNNSPRFPFSRDGGRGKFEKDFSVVEYIVSKEGKKENRKVLPKVCNLVALWRLINAGCIRRTKQDAGVELVPCRWHDLRAPFGTQQAAAYGLWLRNFADWFAEKHPDSPISKWPKLIERHAGILGLFAKLQFMCTLPEAEPDKWAQSLGFAVSNYTPKNVAVIQKARELADSGRKVVIFSAVKQHSYWMAKVLNQLGIGTLSIVEEKNGQIVTMGPKGRANLVRDFIEDGFPILCASVHAMNLGHNLDCASAVIMNGMPWDYASFDQAINRIHRITSKHPVDVFVAQTVCNEASNDFRNGASLDQKMRQLLKDKGESSSLALDGKLPEREEEQIGVQEFLEELAKDWSEPFDTLDEEALRLSLMERAAA
jgi:hypothetical protein